jgi:hypothetical protein
LPPIETDRRRTIAVTERIDALLDALRRDQPADISIERSPNTTEMKVGPETIARIDEGKRALVVYAPPDVRSTLLAQYPGARPDPAGLAFDLARDDQAKAGFDLVRRRARVQRVGWQYRERSP